MCGGDEKCLEKATVYLLPFAIYIYSGRTRKIVVIYIRLRSYVVNILQKMHPTIFIVI